MPVGTLALAKRIELHLGGVLPIQLSPPQDLVLSLV
jgi:hypothetical protein